MKRAMAGAKTVGKGKGGSGVGGEQSTGHTNTLKRLPSVGHGGDDDDGDVSSSEDDYSSSSGESEDGRAKPKAQEVDHDDDGYDYEEEEEEEEEEEAPPAAAAVVSGAVECFTLTQSDLHSASMQSIKARAAMEEIMRRNSLATKEAQQKAALAARLASRRGNKKGVPLAPARIDVDDGTNDTASDIDESQQQATMLPGGMPATGQQARARCARRASVSTALQHASDSDEETALVEAGATRRAANAHRHRKGGAGAAVFGAAAGTGNPADVKSIMRRGLMADQTRSAAMEERRDKAARALQMRLNARYLTSSSDDDSDFDDQDVVDELMHAFHSDNDSVAASSEADSEKGGGGGGGGVLSFHDASFHESDAASSEASSSAGAEDEDEDEDTGGELRLAHGVPGSDDAGAATDAAASGEKKKKKTKKMGKGNRRRVDSGHGGGGGGSGASSPRKNRSRANSADADVRACHKKAQGKGAAKATTTTNIISVKTRAKPSKGSAKEKLLMSFKLAVSAVKVQKPVRKPVAKESGAYEGPRRRTVVMTPDAVAATVTAVAPATAPAVTAGAAATDVGPDADAVTRATAAIVGVGGGGAGRRRASFMGNVSFVGGSAAAPVEASPADGRRASFIAPRRSVAAPSGVPHPLTKQLSVGRAGLVIKTAPAGRNTVMTRAMVNNAAKLMSELGLEKVEDDEDDEDEGGGHAKGDDDDIGDVEDLMFSDDEASAVSLALSFASASEEEDQDQDQDQDVAE